MLTSKPNDKTTRGGRVYLGVYFEKREADLFAYYFYSGTPRAFRKTIIDPLPTISFADMPRVPPELVVLKPVPEVWQADMIAHTKKKGGKNLENVAPVGYIYYGIEDFEENGMRKKVAETRAIYPRSDLGKKSASGMPYWTESITTSDLKARGFTHIMTSNDPSKLRIKQLKRIGLPFKTEVKIEAWLRAMLRGVRGPVSKPHQQRNL